MIYKEIEEFVSEASKDIKIIKSGTLRFFGDWFGRPMDNYHRCMNVSYENDTLKFTFDDNYLLFVENPFEIRIEKQHFSIK